MSTVTVRGIADTLGVSPATVSRSLNNSPDVSETLRARVIAEARRVGYELPRKAVRGNKLRRFGRIGLLFFAETAGPRYSGYDAVIWGGVSRAALATHGFDVCTLNPLDRKADESFGDFAERKGVDGFIVRVGQETRHVARELAAAQVPHVVIADRFEDPAVNYVYCNSTDASRAAIQHLVHLGHARIAITHNAILDTDHRDRIAAYESVLTDAQIELDASLVVPIAAGIGGGAAAFNRLMSLPEPPTAIFATDPKLTIGILNRALEVRVRIPDELSVIGMDDERLRKMTHPVYTAICQNAAELGSQAGRWLCRQLAHNGGRNGESDHLRSESAAFLEINQTTGPRPDRAVRIMPSGQRVSGEPQT